MAMGVAGGVGKQCRAPYCDVVEQVADDKAEPVVPFAGDDGVDPDEPAEGEN